jgi:HK97 family phage major capsid protein
MDDVKDEMGSLAARVNKWTDNEKARIDELRADVRALEQRQLAVYSGGGGPGHLGQNIVGNAGALTAAVTGDEGFKMVASGRIRETTIELPRNAIHGGVMAAALTGTGIGTLDRRLDIAAPAMRRLMIRDLLPQLPTDAGAVEYLVETTMTNAAAVVAEGALKPETSLVLALQNAPVVTIAHWIQVARQILDDNARLEVFLEKRLRHGLGLAEEAQLLYGTGTGGNLKGLTVGATAYVSPFVFATPTKLDQLRLAIDQLENLSYVPTGVVISPDVMTSIDLLKTTDGSYIKSDPTAGGVRTIWGVPAVVTPAMAANTFLVGDFTLAATLFDRSAPILDIGVANDDFIRNLVRLRLEERISLAVTLPKALVTGTFT